ncbi:MAG: TetR/AcrR family transcriptional regulator [Clostridia bacterium]|nr:TetR/AcrR family transcriptional regulator [Clostridia bacterium]
MPKIIPNLRERLLAEAKKQINEKGYSGLTVRSISDALEIAVGTVYNYFPSKEHLIFTYMFEDWVTVLEKARTHPTKDPESYLRNIYRAVDKYAVNNRKLFQDPSAIKMFTESFQDRHRMVRDQLAKIIQPVVHGEDGENIEFLSQFIADSVLSFISAKESFDKVYPILKKLIS